MLSPESVLVTGANRGIGFEMVKQLTKLPKPPKNIFAACRTPDSAKDLKELATASKNVTIIKIDLNDSSCLAESVSTVDRLSPSGLNLLINNAGAAQRDNLDTVTAESMVNLFTVNAVGPLMVIQAFLPLLRKASRGDLDINHAAIVNISTGVASIAENDSGNFYAYRTSKAALNMITKNISLDVRKDNIMVNALHPGWVQTDMGGARASTATTDCVNTLFSLMAKWRGGECHGKFYHFSGREMAW